MGAGHGLHDAIEVVISKPCPHQPDGAIKVAEYIVQEIQNNAASQYQMRATTQADRDAFEQNRKAREAFNKPLGFEEQMNNSMVTTYDLLATRGSLGGIKTAMSISGAVGAGANVLGQVSNRNDLTLHDLTTLDGWKKLDKTDIAIAGLANAGAAAVPAGRGFAGASKQIAGQILVQEVGYASQNIVNNIQAHESDKTKGLTKGGFTAVAITTGTAYAIGKGGKGLKQKTTVVRNSVLVQKHGVLLTPAKVVVVKRGVPKKFEKSVDEFFGAVGSVQQEVLGPKIGNVVDDKYSGNK